MFKLKIAQMISYLLSLNGNKMNLLKLMKELYLADRASIEERDSSISHDVFVSMQHGPVLSMTLNLITQGSLSEFIEQQPEVYFPDIILKKSAGDDLLSKKDKSYLQQVAEKFKNFDRFQLEDYTHRLGEWKDPSGSSIKIRFQDIMRALGKTEEEIAMAKQEYEQLCVLNRHIGV